MRSNILSQTNNIYKCAGQFTLEYHNIEYPELYAYSNLLRKFAFSLGDAKIDDYWRRKHWDFRRIAFLLVGTALEKSFLSREINSIIRELEKEVESCTKLYPDFADGYFRLIVEAKSLLETDIDKVRSKVLGIIEKSKGSTGILIRDTKLIPILQRNFISLAYPAVEIISFSSLRKETCFDNLIVIGPASPIWYPDFIFSSPRAKYIHVLKMNWMSGVWKPSNAFPTPIKSSRILKIINEEEPIIYGEEKIDPELVLPILDFSQIILSAKREFGDNPDDIELVDAFVAYLENDRIVFLENNATATIRVIEMDDEPNPIKSMKIKDLESEMFILLRTSGGGDYIVPIANKIMGDKAEAARSFQRGWKDGLRRMARENGMKWVVNELQSLGCDIARPINVRNWMSYRSIKTNEYSHFLAIMKLIGLEESSQEIWKHMDLINRAHLKAGFTITSLLLDVVKSEKYDDLLRIGFQEYELADQDAGQITAFRIKFISEDTVMVPESKLNVPFDPEEYG